MRMHVVVVAVIVALLAGAGGGFVAGKKVSTSALLAEHAAGFKEGQEATKIKINDRFVAQGLGGPIDEPVKSVYGFVKEVGADEVVVEYDSAQFSFVESGMVAKAVDFSAGTKLQRMTSLPTTLAPVKPPSDGGPLPGKPGSGGGVRVLELPPGGQAEVLGTPAELPDTSVKTFEQKLETIALKDLKVGDYVQIIASNDVRTGERIAADLLIAYDKDAMPAEAGTDPATLPFSRGGAKLDGVPYIPSR